MVTNTTENEWNRALEAVFSRVAIDPAFKTLALEDAHAALKKVSGIQLPADAKIRFVEKVEELVIPFPRGDRSCGEITDSEALEQISGGARNPFGSYYGSLPEEWRLQRGL